MQQLLKLTALGKLRVTNASLLTILKRRQKPFEKKNDGKSFIYKIVSVLQIKMKFLSMKERDNISSTNLKLVIRKVRTPFFPF